MKKILLTLLLAVLTYFLATSYFSLTQSVLIATVTLLVGFWTNGALSLGVVSLLPIVLFPSFGILDTASTTANYAKPIIFLFLGGFLVAIAFRKTGLHKAIACKAIRLFPKKPFYLVLGLALISAMLSCLLSNTTTAILLLPIALFLSDDKKFQARAVLSIAYGASIGGILTPIGTPPNMILFGFLEQTSLEQISFFKWFLKTLPLGIMMLFFVSFILSLGLKNVKMLELSQNEKFNFEHKRLVFIVTVLIGLLILNSPFKPYYNGLGLNESGLLLFFGLLMLTPKIGFLKWSDTKDVPYEIIFLFGAGFAIASAFSHTGLAKELALSIKSLSTLTPILFLLILAAIITFSTEITSNTALTSISLPIIYEFTKNYTAIDPQIIMMVVTICASYAFMLPIATPPNAIALSRKVVEVKQMIRYGFLFNVVGILCIVAVALLIW
jgi:sodium-dependent dicarboxylate transporter 2/3/5